MQWFEGFILFCAFFGCAIRTSFPFIYPGPKTTHLALDPSGKGGKVIFTENIIKGVLKVDNSGGNKKVIIANNLDDS